MTKKKKIIIGAVVFVLIGGYQAKSILMPPPVVHEKISGTIYVLPKDFTLNLSDGRYATMTLGLVLAAGQSIGVADAANPPPTGFGTLPEEPIVRGIVTNLVTNSTKATLLDAHGRSQLEHQILVAIRTGTDVKVDRVLFTDLAVQ